MGNPQRARRHRDGAHFVHQFARHPYTGVMDRLQPGIADRLLIEPHGAQRVDAFTGNAVTFEQREHGRLVRGGAKRALDHCIGAQHPLAMGLQIVHLDQHGGDARIVAVTDGIARPSRYPLAAAQIMERQDQQQRRDGCGQKSKVEPPDQPEIGVAPIGLVNLPFQHEHPQPVQPGAGIALARSAASSSISTAMAARCSRAGGTQRELPMGRAEHINGLQVLQARIGRKAWRAGAKEDLIVLEPVSVHSDQDAVANVSLREFAGDLVARHDVLGVILTQAALPCERAPIAQQLLGVVRLMQPEGGWMIASRWASFKNHRSVTP